MKIVSWNCNGALRKKHSHLDALGADVLIVQECENPAESTQAYREWAGKYLWQGTSKHKGIGIFPKNGHEVAEAKWSGAFNVPGIASTSPAAHWRTEDLELFLPFTVNAEYTILGVWTKGGDDKVFGYIGQVWKYLQIHKEVLSRHKTLIVGDFNSNVIWDKPDRWWNHSDVVAELKEIGIESVYHSSHAEKHGQEKIPTFFLHRNAAKPYHIDYAFASADLLPHCRITVGQIELWSSQSDHMPLVVELRESI
jgi:exodeoxyribonuclease-3